MRLNWTERKEESGAEGGSGRRWEVREKEGVSMWTGGKHREQTKRAKTKLVRWVSLSGPRWGGPRKHQKAGADKKWAMKGARSRALARREGHGGRPHRPPKRNNRTG